MPRKLGWIPDLPDHRDRVYSAPLHLLERAVPPSIDLQPQCPKEIYDQGNIGSCVGNATAFLIEFDQMKQGLPRVTPPSRLFIYYGARKRENSILFDQGCAIRDAIKTVAKEGVCPETMWPYDDTAPQNPGDPCRKCAFAKQPTLKCYKEAWKHKVIVYQRIGTANLSAMKACIASGFPFIFGFTVYENFPWDDAGSPNGIVPMPEGGVAGGHAVAAVGYEDASRLIKFRNSWGAAWAQDGYGFMPYDYLANQNLADDLWTIRIV